MSRRPTFYRTFPILDNHYNSNFMRVDVKGNYFVDASYRHLNNLILPNTVFSQPLLLGAQSPEYFCVCDFMSRLSTIILKARYEELIGWRSDKKTVLAPFVV